MGIMAWTPSDSSRHTEKAAHFREKGASLEVRKQPGSDRPWIYSIWHNSVRETGIVAQTELALRKSVRSKS
jgi:hypothetical protein